jgi:hypothetical protein
VASAPAGEGLVWTELPLFQRSQYEIERELLTLGVVHTDILELFNECFDGAFHADDRWCDIRAALGEAGERLSKGAPRDA